MHSYSFHRSPRHPCFSPFLLANRVAHSKPPCLAGTGRKSLLGKVNSGLKDDLNESYKDVKPFKLVINMPHRILVQLSSDKEEMKWDEQGKATSTKKSCHLMLQMHRNISYWEIFSPKQMTQSFHFWWCLGNACVNPIHVNYWSKTSCLFPGLSPGLDREKSWKRV